MRGRSVRPIGRVAGSVIAFLFGAALLLQAARAQNISVAPSGLHPQWRLDQPYVYGRGSFVCGNGPVALASGDLNGDGVSDIVTADGGSGTVSVLIGRFDGRFAPPAAYPAGVEPNALALADLDGDSRLDLVVVDQNCPSGTCGHGAVRVRLGQGDGSFGSATAFGTNTNPQSVAVGDFDEDSVPDLAVVNAVTIISQGPGTVSILRGLGGGMFAAGTEFPAGNGPGSIVVADFDHDDHLDLAITNFVAIAAAHAVALLSGNGDGTFSAPATSDTALGPVGLVAADFNHDGDLDLATAALADNELSVLLGLGDGTFLPHADFPAGFGPKSIALADLDADGDLDLVLTVFTGISGGGSVAVLLGDGGGGFGPLQEYTTGPIGPAILADDVDGDGRQDLLAPDLTHHVAVFLGRGDGTLAEPASLPSGNTPVSVDVADFDGDQHADLVVANSGAGTFSLLLGQGDGTFAPNVDVAAGAGPTGIVAADFDHDGKSDVAHSHGGGSVMVQLGHGDGTFTPRVSFATGASPAALTVGDFNGDTRLDLATANQGANTISLLRGVGNGTFLAKLDAAAGPGPVSIASADFDGDGKLDLAVADANTGSFGPGRVSVLLGHGDGTFAAPLALNAGIEAAAVTAADLNADGKPDIAVATNLDVFGSAAILIGNGNGTFQPQVTYPVGRIAAFIGSGDFNGDGRRDLVVTNEGNNTLTVLRGTGGGAFELQANHATGFGPLALASGHFDADGRLDLAVLNLANTISVFTSAP